MISIDLSETAHFAHWKSETTSEKTFFLTIFFPTKFFSDQKYFSRILSQTGFCLGLNFVSDYIPLFYFVWNHLISTFTDKNVYFVERENLTFNIHRQRRPKTSIGTIRYHDIEKAKRVTYVHKPNRGDFLLHPQWPPSIPHHRLSGLSSVEIPYGTGKR